MFLSRIEDKYEITEELLYNKEGVSIKIIIDKETKKRYILKMITNIKSIVKEVVFTTALKHPNIIQLVDWSYSDGIGFLIYPKGENIKNVDINIDKFIKDIFSAIIFLHDNNIFHGDIKRNNIVYFPETDNYTLIDFGLSTIAFNYDGTKWVHGICGTENYHDPTYFYTDLNNIKTELYSLALTLKEVHDNRSIKNYHHYNIKVENEKINTIIKNLTRNITARHNLSTIVEKYKIPINKNVGNIKKLIKMDKQFNNNIKILIDSGTPIEIVIKSLMAYQHHRDDFTICLILIQIYSYLYNYSSSNHNKSKINKNKDEKLYKNIDIINVLKLYKGYILVSNDFDRAKNVGDTLKILKSLGFELPDKLIEYYNHDKNITFNLINGIVENSLPITPIKQAINQLNENNIVSFYNHYKPRFSELDIEEYGKMMDILRNNKHYEIIQRSEKEEKEKIKIIKKSVSIPLSILDSVQVSESVETVPLPNIQYPEIKTGDGVKVGGIKIRYIECDDDGCKLDFDHEDGVMNGSEGGNNNLSKTGEPDDGESSKTGEPDEIEN